MKKREEQGLNLVIKFPDFSVWPIFVLIIACFIGTGLIKAFTYKEAKPAPKEPRTYHIRCDKPCTVYSDSKDNSPKVETKINPNQEIIIQGE